MEVTFKTPMGATRRRPTSLDGIRFVTVKQWNDQTTLLVRDDGSLKCSSCDTSCEHERIAQDIIDVQIRE